jgi:hypothetical protein
MRLKIALIFFAIIGVVQLLPWQSLSNELYLKLIGRNEDTYGTLPKLVIEGDTLTCENSIQGKYFVSDSRGFICSRNDINQTNGCCNSFVHFKDSRKQNSYEDFGYKYLRQNNFTGRISKLAYKQFDCTNCVSSCCQEYENCISCCLSPSNLQKYLSLHMSAPVLHRVVISDSNLITQRQSFVYCKHVCRTNSKSVQMENSYRGYHNHCFSEQLSIIEKLPINSDRAGFQSSFKKTWTLS